MADSTHHPFLNSGPDGASLRGQRGPTRVSDTMGVLTGPTIYNVNAISDTNALGSVVLVSWLDW